MQLTMNGADLSRAAAWASALISRRPQAPELAGMLLSADDTHDGAGLTLTATDLDATGTTTVSAFVQASGRCLVSGILLAAIAKLLAREDEVTLAVGDKTLGIRVGRSRWELPLLDPINFPGMPQGGAALGTVSPSALAAALERVLVAVGDGRSADPMRGGVGLSAEENGPLVAATTDRHRLAVAELEWTSDGDLPSILVPAGILRAAVSAMRDASEPVTLSSTGETVAFSTSTHTVIGRLLADRGDAWRKLEKRIQAANSPTTATVSTTELRTIVNRAVVTLVADDTLAMRVDADGVSAWRAEGSQGEHDCSVETFEGDERTFRINPRYLRDLLDKVESPAMRVEFPTDRRGYMIVVHPCTEAGEAIPGFYMAQAPMRLATETAGAA